MSFISEIETYLEQKHEEQLKWFVENLQEMSCARCQTVGFKCTDFLIKRDPFITSVKCAMIECPGCKRYVCTECSVGGNCDCRECENGNDEASYCRDCLKTHDVYHYDEDLNEVYYSKE